MLHFFKNELSQISLPEKFTYPFHYIPHPLCVMAAEEVKTYVATKTRWEKELSKGKMFGVLVVQDKEGNIGYLAAFSGNIAKKNIYPFFVPPVYNLLEPDGFFKKVEARISEVNARLAQMENDPEYLGLFNELNMRKREWDNLSAELKAQMKESKKKRDNRRKNAPSQEELDEMIRESQQEKIQYKKLANIHKETLTSVESAIQKYELQIHRLKIRRQDLSGALQKKTFKQFKVLNNYGIMKDLYTIFKETVHKTPPAGAGECAAPKLLQYAYLNELKPIAMAEFWWGQSLKSEIRHHGYYYPSCKEKCEPILHYMLQGLDVEDNPLSAASANPSDIEIVYEDKWLLVINKPENILSVPGKQDTFSISQWAKKRYPKATGPMIAHRLDMATSGLLLISKTKEVHQSLQAQFCARIIKKRYIALLDGILPQDKGTITLPLCSNPADRPRQMVSTEHGKYATTRYEVLSRSDGKTRVAFYPLTGRTHQLRVHAAHPDGLNCPITGDPLYGKPSDRLYLHAEHLIFIHPVSDKIIRIERKAPF